MKNFRKILCLIMALIIILSLTSCGSSNNSYVVSDYMATNTSYGGISGVKAPLFASQNKSESFYDSDISDGNGAIKTDTIAEEAGIIEPSINTEKQTEDYNERKIVYTANINSETKDIEKAMDGIYKLIDNNNGYIENESKRNWNSFEDIYTRRSCDIKIRVPSENFSTFLDSISDDNMVITSMNKYSTDLSNEYYDKETRVESLKIQEIRLMELLKDASSVDIMLQIENSLSDVRYEIETLTRDLKLIDSNVDYSTISIYISEVQRYTPTAKPTSFFEELWIRICESFKNFGEWMKELLFVIINLLPFLIIIAVIICIIVVVIKKKKNKKNKQNNKDDKDKSE